MFRCIRRIAKGDYYLRHIRQHGTTRPPPDGFLWNLVFEHFSKICGENSSLVKNLTRITGTLHEDRYTFLIILAIDQLSAHILVLWWVYCIPLRVSNTVCSSSGGQIVLYSIRYRHTERSAWPEITKIPHCKYELIDYTQMHGQQNIKISDNILFFLEWEMLQLKVCRKIGTHSLYLVTPPPPDNRPFMR